MTDCKNCKYTDEYCASGECTSQSPRNHLATTSQVSDLTEQWKNGKLPVGWYYIKIADIVFIDFFEGKVWKNKKDEYIDEVLAPVPSYEEYWHIRSCLNDQALILNENIKLKELLKECELWFTGTIGNMNDKNVGEHNRNLPIGNFEHMFKVFSQKINNALED